MGRGVMGRVGEHPVPAGPLAVRWLAYELPELRAGVAAPARVALRNDGTATWRTRGESGVQLSHHWLDDRGNAIVWDGPRVGFERPVAPGEEVELETSLRAPQPPGRYRLAFDLVEEFRFWFAEVGSSPLELDVVVSPRIAERRLAVVVHGGEDTETAAGLVAARARRPRGGFRGGRRLDRDTRPSAASLGAGRRSQSGLRSSAPAAVALVRTRARTARGPPSLRAERGTL